MRKTLPVLVFAVLGVVFAGCSDATVIAVGGGLKADASPPNDASVQIQPDGAVVGLVREIVLLHDVTKPVALVITDEFPIRAKVIDYVASGPATDALVTFEIVTNDNDGDASLTAMQAYTDPQGEVSVNFRANLVPDVNYRVRLVTAGAKPVEFDLHVGNEPTGDIEVNLAYEGPIAIKNVHLRLLPGHFTCGQFKATNVPLDVVGEQTVLGLGADDGDSVLFEGLPASKKFTVVATAQSPTGSLAAAGCLDGVVVVPETVNSVTMTMYLLVLNPAGFYDAITIFDFTGAIPGQVGEIVDAIVTLFNNPGKFLIDTIKAGVSLYIGELVTDLAFGLFEDELAKVISDWLLNDSPDWLQDVFVVGQDLTQIVHSLELQATLVISKLSNDYYVQGMLYWTGIVLYWKLGCAKEGEAEYDPECGKYVFSLEDLENTEFPMQLVEGKFTGFIHDFDRLDIDNHVIKLNYGKLILFVLNEMILKTLTGEDNLTDALLKAVNCAKLADNFSNAVLDGIGIDEDDIEGFCISAITTLASPVTLLVGNLALDSQLRLSGKATMVDEDDDLKVDRIIDGTYVGHVEADGQEGPEFHGVWEAVKQEEEDP